VASVQTHGSDVSMSTWPNDSVPCGMLIWHFWPPNGPMKLCHVAPPGDAMWQVPRRCHMEVQYSQWQVMWQVQSAGDMEGTVNVTRYSQQVTW
jgi:hypothetical protein